MSGHKAKKSKSHKHAHQEGRFGNCKPSTLGHFITLAPGIMKSLMDKLQINEIQAAAIVGNLGTESKDFTAHHEFRQRKNRGGYGWAQWTGKRREDFFEWCEKNGLEPETAAASEGFLVYELTNAYSKVLAGLRQKKDLVSATHYFMKNYEAPKIEHEKDRQAHAFLALEAYKGKQPKVNDCSEKK